MLHVGEPFQGQCLRDIERTGGRAPQSFHMCTAPQCRTDVHRQTTDIGTLGTAHIQHQAVTVQGNQVEGIDA